MEYRFIARDTGEDNVTPEYIRQLEEKLDIRFPQVLVEYYLHHNMAETKEEVCFRVFNLEFYLNYLNPLRYGDVPVEDLLKYMAGKPYLSPNLIPLAEDEEGDNFYWDSKTGKVCYICRENVMNPIPICDSVEAFIELLNNSCE